jgi:hypothetical protein
MEWDPCTFNNNDWQEFPTYDAANAARNRPSRPIATKKRER